MVEMCKCKHWYNTKIKCPECRTIAKEKFADKIKKYFTSVTKSRNDSNKNK